ncbi:MAG: hypothetical protein ACOZQL_15190 [Myxococcota bacterium]
MRWLVGLCCVVASGCVSFPSARLVVTPGLREELAAPVVCGPMGFRRVPLQSRWGEFVRITVASPVVLRGSVLVHANGSPGEPRAWTTADGNLVVESRFENLDPDGRFALERSRPIDLTISGLEAPNGGTCEGAVFTVEQGELVPSIDERWWIAELERRGGPELAARREAVRREQDARRQAHYAAWEQRQRVEVSAELALEQERRREEHYAAWDARHVVVGADVSCSSGVCGGVAPSVASSVGSSCASGVCGGVASSVASSSSVVVPSCASGACVGVPAPVDVRGATACASGACGVPPSVASSSSAVNPSCASGVCGGVPPNVGGAVVVATASCVSGACDGAPSSVASSSSVVSPSCAAGGCDGAVVVGATAPSVVPSGDVGGAVACASGRCQTDVGFAAGATCAATVSAGTQLANTEQVSWSLCSGSCARGAAVASAPSEWRELPVDTSWAQPVVGQVSAEWAQPFPVTLEPVVVSTESRVAVAAPTVVAPAPPPAPVCDADCSARAGFSVALPALFQVMLNAGALMPTMPPPGTQHAAVPASERR